MLRPVSSAAAVALTLGLIAAPAIGVPGLLMNKYSPDEVTVVCQDGTGRDVGEVTYEGPLKLWPPNHKYQPITITATAYEAGENQEVTLETVGTHDEYLEDGSEMNGAGNTTDDVSPAADTDSGTGSASTGHSLRSERSGRGDGRSYTLDWHATFESGTTSCGSPEYDGERDAFEVFVPHDMRCGADWKGGNNGNGGNGQCATG